MSDLHLTIDDLNALPERMRAHAAAKAVGMTSKEFLAAMSGIGVEVKSAQSSVTREVLLTWFDGRDQSGGGSAPQAATADAPAPAETTRTPAKKAAAKKAPAKKAAARKAVQADVTAGERPADQAVGSAAETAPASTGAAGTDAASTDSGESTPAKKAPRKRPPRKTAAQKAAEAEAASAQTDDQGGGSDAAAGSSKSQSRKTQSRPALPEIAIVTGEVGTDDPGNRRRRSNATPSFSPLFLSPDESGARPARSSGPGRSGGDPADATPADSKADAAVGRADSDAVGRAADDSAIDDTSVDESGQDQDRREDGQSGQGEGGNRRRRRGRRGRGRGRGEDGDDQNTDNADDDNDDSGSSADGRDDAERSGDSRRGGSPDETSGSDDDSDDGQGSDEDGSDDDSDGSDSSPSGSRRRRRRRRRSGGSGSDDTQSSQDDPPNTEVHERDSRRRTGRGGQAAGGTSADEVQGITGSTRLEAKRQRRRDGREAGRRRPPILSESEFLARREAVDRVMVVREKQRVDDQGVMTQVGVLEDKVLVEHFVTTESARSMVGNVYLGRVQNVLPSMEAAFVDIGRGRNGVLYAGEVNWEAAGLGGRARRIEQALKPGDMVLVQVTKDPVGQKGARLSTQISLAGRFLVYVPDGNSAGISRKLPDTERRRLKAILKDVVPEGSGVIIRTAAEGVSEEEIGRDVERLAGQWTEIAEAAAKRTESGSGTPIALYEEPDLLVKVVRDLFNEDFTKLVIQGETSWNTVHGYVSRVAPEMVERLERYDNPEVDVFATYRVDEQLAKALDRKVWLPSGGSLVIDRTEAMTVVDVNTGKYTGSGGNLEETVTKNNLEAAEEIVRQLRLRDVGGMVIIDFIDMVLEGNRDLVLRRLTEALGRDRTRHQVSEVTSLGLVQLTRKKLGTGLVEAFSTPCEHCQGRGLIVHADPIHTESHNADEPGSRRGGRRRGGSSKGTESGGEAAAPKQAPRKDGPAPAAHPAALAISRHDEHGTTDDDAVATDAATEATAESVSADAAAAAPAEIVAPAEAAAPAAAPSREPAATDTATGDAPAATAGIATEAGSSAEATDPADAQATSESSGTTGSTRSARRRRATRRAPSSAPASTGAAGQSAGASDSEATVTPQAGSDTGSEAAAAADEAASGAGTSPDAADAGAGASGQSGRRPRRRSSRREAGAAETDAVTDAASDPARGAGTPAAPEAPAAKVEPAALAEAPTVVVAEPRKRPARRRATRSTTAPEGD